MLSKSTRSDLKESSDENLHSNPLDLTNWMTSSAVSCRKPHQHGSLSRIWPAAISHVCSPCSFRANAASAAVMFQWRYPSRRLVWSDLGFWGWCTFLVPPVSTAILASSIWHRTWVRILACSQTIFSKLDCLAKAWNYGTRRRAYLEPQIANDFAVLSRLLRGCGRGQLYIFHAMVVSRSAPFAPA